MRTTITAVCALVLVGCGGGGSSSPEAQTCNDLQADGVTVAQAEGIISSALGDGVPVAKLRAECGAIIDTVTNALGYGPLSHQVEVTLASCKKGGYLYGKAVNNSTSEVDITLKYELLGNNGERINDGLVFIDGLAAGQTAQVKENLFDDAFGKCTLEIDSVRPSD